MFLTFCSCHFQIWRCRFQSDLFLFSNFCVFLSSFLFLGKSIFKLTFYVDSEWCGKSARRWYFEYILAKPKVMKITRTFSLNALCLCFNECNDAKWVQSCETLPKNTHSRFNKSIRTVKREKIWPIIRSTNTMNRCEQECSKHNESTVLFFYSVYVLQLTYLIALF